MLDVELPQGQQVAVWPEQAVEAKALALASPVEPQVTSQAASAPGVELPQGQQVVMWLQRVAVVKVLEMMSTLWLPLVLQAGFVSGIELMQGWLSLP